jgi:hypothetical protein
MKRQIPYASIRWYIGTLHVGNPDDLVAQDITNRLRSHNRDITASQIKKCVDYALKCHHENQELYRAVVSGNL